MLFVGDKVRCPDGEGYVEEVWTWRDRVLAMSDAEATEFSAQCRRTHGPDYQKVWGRAVVRVNQAARGYDVRQVTVLEGRDDIR